MEIDTKGAVLTPGRSGVCPRAKEELAETRAAASREEARRGPDDPLELVGVGAARVVMELC